MRNLENAVEKRFIVEIFDNDKKQIVKLVTSNKYTDFDDVERMVLKDRPLATIMMIKELQCIDREGGEWI